MLHVERKWRVYLWIKWTSARISQSLRSQVFTFDCARLKQMWGSSLRSLTRKVVEHFSFNPWIDSGLFWRYMVFCVESKGWMGRSTWSLKPDCMRIPRISQILCSVHETYQTRASLRTYRWLNARHTCITYIIDALYALLKSDCLRRESNILT